MTVHARNSALTHLQENGLDPRFEKLIIERARLRTSRRGRSRSHPLRHRLPLRIALRVPMFAAVMEWIAARFGRQWMHEQLAGHRIARNHLAQSRFEIAPRLSVVPRRSARRQALQPKRSAARMADIAASVSRPFGQEDGLDARLEKFEIQRLARERRHAGRRHYHTSHYCRHVL